MLRVAAVVGSAALVGGLLSVPLAAEAAPDTGLTVPAATAAQIAASKFKAGKYVVTLKDAPAATYTGGISGYAGTKVARGHQLNASSAGVKKYSNLMLSKQKSLATQVGVKSLYNYTVAYNGFGAQLTAKQALRLSKSSDVLSVVPAITMKIQESKSLDFLNISTAGGTWDQVGGVADAGKGIVVGDIDTGIAPENPSFVGDPLGTDSTTGAPYLDGNVVKFAKADGNTFTSTETTDTDEWNSDDYSTKIIAAHDYIAGFGEANIGSNADGEYVSPRDGAGHGSHTASTAAGDHGVAATVQGQDFGTISGVAPAAKLAIYKACWSGPDPTVETDDGCNTLDMLAAINQAVADGVDVINFSIGGGSAATTYSPTDAAFLNAAAAGIFVSAAAGNDGPGASTLDNAAPWETTVAASTIPDYEGTVELGNGSKIVGAGISVTDTVEGNFIDAAEYAIDTSADGVTAATLCEADSLKPVPADSIVLCDRGGNARLDKSAEVLRAGGIGMVLTNVEGGADDVDNDFHSVPSIHVSNVNHDALHEYADTAGATVSLIKGNDTPDSTPVPQIAGFSSHGPVLAAGSDVLKPDIAAPGVSILAAVANAEGGDPKWDFYSGTSMATPHITGLAAVYLGEHPLAGPAEIKSAMMTGATDLVDADGADVTDPFTQGAGEVHPKTYLNPGFYYPADLDDWKSYIVGADQAADYTPYVPLLDLDGVEPIDGSDLNQASIAIGDFIGGQTVTRTVTSTQAGDYSASVDVPGVSAVVTPNTLHFGAAGETKSFTVAFTNNDAPADAWTTGFLTWTGTTDVRSPIALHPTTALVPATATGTGVVGSADFTVTGGTDTDLDVNLPSLFLGDINDDHIVKDDDAFYEHTVLANTASAEFDVDPVGAPSGTDLDLYVLYSPVSSNDLSDYTLVGQSATSSGSESVTLVDPPAGSYVTDVNAFDTVPAGVDFEEAMYADNAKTNASDVSVTPNPLPLTTGDDSTATAHWWGLAPDSSYRGYVTYGDTGLSTQLSVTTTDGIAPANMTLPAFTGTGTVGSTLTATAGTWDYAAEHLTFDYAWTADGSPIVGATDSTFVVPAPLLGKTIGLTVTAHLGASGQKAATAANTVIVKGSDGSATLNNITAPSIEGSVQTGKTVTANPGTFNISPDELAFTYQWSAGGAAISGATGSSFTIPSSLLGSSLSVAVTAKQFATTNTVTANSAGVIVAANDGQPSLANTAVPTISGTALLGKTVKASMGAWNIPTGDLSFTYQWTANGMPIAGATSASYKIGSSTLGKSLAVTVTARLGASVASASSTKVKVKASSTTTISLSDSTITTTVKEKVTVKVKADGSGKETGTVVIHYGSKKKTDVLHASDHGKIVITLPKLKKGTYKVYAEFEGNSNVVGDKSITKKLTVRKAK